MLVHAFDGRKEMVNVGVISMFLPCTRKVVGIPKFRCMIWLYIYIYIYGS